MVNKVRVSGMGFPLTRADQCGLKAGDEVNVSYTLLPNQTSKPLMLVLTHGSDPAIKPTMLQVQKMVNELKDGASIQKRIGKTIDAPDSVTPDELKSAIPIKSPIDMRDILIQRDQSLNSQHGHEGDVYRSDVESIPIAESEASR